MRGESRVRSAQRNWREQIVERWREPTADYRFHNNDGRIKENPKEWEGKKAASYSECEVDEDRGLISHHATDSVEHCFSILPDSRSITFLILNQHQSLTKIWVPQLIQSFTTISDIMFSTNHFHGAINHMRCRMEKTSYTHCFWELDRRIVAPHDHAPHNPGAKVRIPWMVPVYRESCALCNSPATACPLIRKFAMYAVVWRGADVLARPRQGQGCQDERVCPSRRSLSIKCTFTITAQITRASSPISVHQSRAVDHLNIPNM